MIYLDKPYVLIQWNAEDRWVELQSRSYAAGEEYRTTLNKEMEALIIHGSTKLLCDLRNMAVVAAEDQEWNEKEFTPKLLRNTKLKYCALVLPRSALAHMSLKRIISKSPTIAQREVVMAYFDDVEKAKVWLRSPK